MCPFCCRAKQDNITGLQYEHAEWEKKLLCYIALMETMYVHVYHPHGNYVHNSKGWNIISFCSHFFPDFIKLDLIALMWLFVT